MMSVENLTIVVYCMVEDLYRSIVGETKLRVRGPSPKLRDTEVLTMEIVGEFIGLHQDEKIWSHFRRHWRHFFPALGDRSAFVRQGADLWRIKQLMQTCLARILGAFRDPHHLIDGFPMKVCVLTRASRKKIFRGITANSYCASKKLFYHGFKGHLLVSFEGIITSFCLTPANCDEREAAWDLVDDLSGWWFGDKGYISAFFKSLLREQGIALDTPVRRNMTDTCDSKERSVRGRVRRMVETVIGQLTERFELGIVRARKEMQLTARCYRKLLAHTVMCAINRMSGRETLDFDGILTQ